MAQARAVQANSEVRFNRFLALVYLVMAIGMAVTALVATSVSANEDLMKRILYDPWFTFGLFMIQIIVVVWLSAAVMRMSPAVAFLLFLFYSALTGLALSAIFIYYSQSVISYTFWMAAGMFLFSSIVGFFIKGDMSAVGSTWTLLTCSYYCCAPPGDSTPIMRDEIRSVVLIIRMFLPGQCSVNVRKTGCRVCPSLRVTPE
jgi:FtsH-binding integral membrane protein